MFSPFSYQQDGAEWLADKPFAILADEQRVGKTGQLLMAADRVARRVSITCPASAVPVWEAAIPNWTWGFCDFDIRSYDRATDHGLIRGADTYIFDEAHKLKNIESQRTQALLGYASPVRRAARVWAASGTIAQNHVGELHPWMRFGGLTDLGKQGFLARYTKFTRGEHGPKVWGNNRETLPELKEKLRPVFLRRLRKDVYPGMPPALWDDIPIRALNVGCVDSSIANTIYMSDSLPQEDEHIARLRRAIGEAKAGALADFLADELEGGDQRLVVYAWHQSVMDALHQRLDGYGVVRICGRTRPAERLARPFVDRPSARVFLGQIIAAGEAIDCCPASNFVFAEMSWNPKDNEQAMCRILGPNQVEPALIRTATLKGSLDEAVHAVNGRKTRALNELYGDL